MLAAQEDRKLPHFWPFNVPAALAAWYWLEQICEVVLPALAIAAGAAAAVVAAAVAAAALRFDSLGAVTAGAVATGVCVAEAPDVFMPAAQL